MARRRGRGEGSVSQRRDGRWMARVDLGRGLSGRRRRKYVYAATQAAVHTFSRALRVEVAEAGVRVMTIEIHNVGGTEFAGSFDPAILPAAIQRWTEVGVLNPRTPLLEADDVARAIAFQLSQPPRASVHDLILRSRAN